MNIWFEDPFPASMATSKPRTFDVILGLNLSSLRPKGQLTARLYSSSTATISPNDGVYDIPADASDVTFSVTVPENVVATLLSAKIFDDDTEVASANPGVNVMFWSMPGPLPVTARKAEDQAEAKPKAAPKKVAAASTLAPTLPIMFTGFLTTSDETDADGVVCLAYRVVQGRMEIDYVSQCDLLAGGRFLILLDGKAAVGRRYYRLNWINRFGDILEIQSDRISAITVKE